MATAATRALLDSPASGRRCRFNRRSVPATATDVDLDMLNLGPTLRVLDLERDHVRADKVRFRLVEGDEGRHLQGEALLVVGGSNLAFLDADRAIGRRVHQPNGWQRSGRAIRLHVQIDADLDV